jgi:hypothetical protein
MRLNGSVRAGAWPSSMVLSRAFRGNASSYGNGEVVVRANAANAVDQATSFPPHRMRAAKFFLRHAAGHRLGFSALLAACRAGQASTLRQDL